MFAGKTFLRISKFVGKAIVGLLLVLLIVVGLIHVPFVQGQLTSVVSDYLSATIKARVDLKSISFSILGDASIKGLKVWDREAVNIFSAGEVDVTTSIFDLLIGDLIFDEVHIAGVSGQLVQSKEGLNIQFIIDAFQPTPTQATEASSTNLQLKRVVLEDIAFDFKSPVDGTSVSGKLGTFTCNDLDISTNPNRISANKVYLDNSLVNIVYTGHTDTVRSLVVEKDRTLLIPDFGTGIVFEFTDVALNDNNFSIHRDTIRTTAKFDPAHIDLKNIHVSLSEILIRADTLAAALRSISGELPGFKLSEGKATINLNPNLAALSGVRLVSNTNELNADLLGGYHLKSGKDDDRAHMDIDALVRINPRDFAYFFADSIMKYFGQWEQTEMQVRGNYALRNGELKTLSLKTKNSQLQVRGMIHDVLNPEKINWNDVVIHSSVGPDFRHTLMPLLKSITLPPDILVQVNSSGNLKKLFVDGNIFSTWGNLKAKGFLTEPSGKLAIDLNVIGEKVDAGKWMSLAWLGTTDLSVDATGNLGLDRNVKIQGLINTINILNEPIREINLAGSVTNGNSTAALSISDPKYRSKINSEISFAGPLLITNNVRFNNFKAGTLLHGDTTLSVSGGMKSEIKISGSILEGYVESDSILFANQFTKYLLDTLSLKARVSPTANNFEYYTDYEKGKLVSNFDIRDAQELMETWSEGLLKSPDNTYRRAGNRKINLDLELVNANLFQLLDIDVDHFSSLHINGELDEQKQTGSLVATTGNFKGYGISLDTLSTNLSSTPDDLTGDMRAQNLFYNSIQLGSLDFSVFTKEDTATSILLLSGDSATTLGLRARTVRSDSGVFVIPDKLQAFGRDYLIDARNPIYIDKTNVDFEQFTIRHDDTQISLDGDLNAFEINLTKVDLTPLNYLLFPDSAVINKGYLTGRVSYIRDEKLDLKADVDSLSLYNSNLLTIAATAVTNKNQVPFEFLLTNTSNKVDVKGQYSLDNKNVDATLSMDVNNLELFAFLVSGVIDKMNGTFKGEAKISGPIQKPEVQGDMRLMDVAFTTSNPKLTFNVKDDVITLNNSGLLFKDFTMYDEGHNPLTINGHLKTEDYKSFAYDLRLNTDQFNLLNNADSSTRKLRGLLVVASNTRLTGNEKDTNVEAEITIKGATNLTYVDANNDIELLKSEGIIDFIDPLLLLDSVKILSGDFYDSLIASLPDFNLNSTVKIEDDATIRIIIDEQSGDYAEASGGARLELGYDRTGNVRLSGNYTIKKGVYRLSFYDLVKKNFTLVPGSSINWSGSPENGELDIRAVHTVETNSIGLIGDEVGDNEKSIYKRSLDYEVGINIKGTIEKPVVSFSLDLPKEEKANYPVLANKLDRLRLPEYGSELNKQVFGLLVLGGFLPETSGADINSNVIATTALSNSVNSLLAGQLNRFASQYVKGVNIDVGIQSYSDYSAPGGKTRTAMDFRVSKTVLNERLSFEIGGDFDINQDQSGSNTGSKNYRGDIAIIYDLTGGGDKQLKLFNNETYDIIYQEIRNTGISLIFIREFDKNKKSNNQVK